MKIKTYYLEELKLPYLTKNEWELVSSAVQDFRDSYIKLYFEEMRDLAELNQFFHPLNDSRLIINRYFKSQKISNPKDTSFESFIKTKELVIKVIESKPFEFYLAGAKWLESKSVNDLWYFHQSYIRPQIFTGFPKKQIHKGLLEVLEKLPQKRIQELERIIKT